MTSGAKPGQQNTRSRFCSSRSTERPTASPLEPVDGIADEDAEQLRVAVGRVITNPTAHRSELLALVIELAPQPPA